MNPDDRRRLAGSAAGGAEKANGQPSGVDRHGLANLALVFADVAATLSALARECDSLEGAELSRQALAIEAELGNTEVSVHDTRRFLRDLARAALLK